MVTENAAGHFSIMNEAITCIVRLEKICRDSQKPNLAAGVSIDPVFVCAKDSGKKRPTDSVTLRKSALDRGIVCRCS